MARSYNRRSGILRRRFLQTTAATAWASTFVPQRAFGSNDRVRVAAIGIGGKGASDIADIAKAGGEIVALCDVDQRPPRRGSKIRDQFPKAQFYQDFREMLDKESKRIDAVSVSTPDHTHFPAAIWAMRRGKHVYCQKPLTHSIWEARQMALAAKQFNVATQMGNQGHASESVRLGVEWIRGGIVGKVQEVHTWTNRPIWPQGLTTRPKVQPTPSMLNWDAWLGPAPKRPYHEAYCPFNWRGWWDFGTGALGDMGCHIMDMPYWALELSYPTHVRADSKGNTAESGPTESTVAYTFAPGKYHDELKFVWYDGNRMPPRDVTSGIVDTIDGTKRELTAQEVQKRFHAIVVGDKGKFFFSRSNAKQWRTAPGTLAEGFAPKKLIPRVPNEDVEWLTACRGGSPAASSFEFSGPFTEVVLLGNLAIRLDKPIDWDGESMTATNAPEAAELIRRSYRKGWDI